MNCLKLKRFSYHLQVSFKGLVIICRHWYRLYIPAEFTHRRNTDQIKTTDSLILALLTWQVKTGIESQRGLCECFNCLSHSRFNRRLRQLSQLIYQIWQETNKKVDLNGYSLIIDSFPVPVYQPIRNCRAKTFRGYANICYKVTKKIYFYGFRIHATVGDNGYILDYVVTKAPVHDAKEIVGLLENARPSNYYLPGDEGYLGKELHQQLKQMGYKFRVPYHKNMIGAKKHNDHQLMATRKTVESDFSLLTYYSAEDNRARSLIGF